MRNTRAGNFKASSSLILKRKNISPCPPPQSVAPPNSPKPSSSPRQTSPTSSTTKPCSPLATPSKTLLSILPKGSSSPPSRISIISPHNANATPLWPQTLIPSESGPKAPPPPTPAKSTSCPSSIQPLPATGSCFSIAQTFTPSSSVNSPIKQQNSTRKSSPDFIASTPSSSAVSDGASAYSLAASTASSNISNATTLPPTPMQTPSATSIPSSALAPNLYNLPTSPRANFPSSIRNQNLLIAEPSTPPPTNRKTGSAPFLNSSQANDLGAPLFANPAEPGFKNRTPSTI